MPRILLLAAMVCRVLPAAEQNQLDANQNLFTVMAALNAAGYDEGVSSPAGSPLRNVVRQALAAQRVPVLSELRDFYKRHPQFAPYISLALSISSPPDFHFTTRNVDIPPDAFALDQFLPLLTRFYSEAKIGELWARVQPAHEAAIEPYHEPLTAITQGVNSYFRNTSAGYLGRRFLVYVDLLAAPDQVQTRSYGDLYFVVVTHASRPHTAELRHAYLHYLVEPLVAKYGLDLMKKAALSDYAAPAPNLPESYKNDFVLLVSECLIKAVESRLDRKPEAVPAALHDGYILTPFFSEQLVAYEKQPTAMRLYFPDLLQALDSRREAQRFANLTFTPKAPDLAAAPSPKGPEPVLTASRKLLDEADKLRDGGKNEEARAAYLRAVDRAENPTERAHAYFGLARMALKAGDGELSEKLLLQVLSEKPEPFQKGWSLCYLGRLYYLAGEPQKALRYYQAALAVPDASDAALQAARKGVEQIQKK